MNILFNYFTIIRNNFLKIDRFNKIRNNNNNKSLMISYLLRLIFLFFYFLINLFSNNKL